MNVTAHVNIITTQMNNADIIIIQIMNADIHKAKNMIAIIAIATLAITNINN